MAVTHTWLIDKLIVENDGSKTVTKIFYAVESSSSSTGTKVLEEGTVELREKDSSNFIPYDSLTESTVIGWVKSRLLEDFIDLNNINTEENNITINDHMFLEEQKNIDKINFIDNKPMPKQIPLELPW